MYHPLHYNVMYLCYVEFLEELKVNDGDKIAREGNILYQKYEE